MDTLFWKTSEDRVRRFRGRSAEDIFPNETERLRLNGDGPGGGRACRIDGVDGDEFSW